jgi:hypothetical protein
MGYLYALELQGKVVYIGQTLGTLERRAARMLAQARATAKPHQKGIYAALRCHGPENFTVRPLVVANDREYLLDLERKAIAAYGTREHGFNLRQGGEVPSKLTEKGRKRLKGSMRKRWRDPKERGRFLEWSAQGRQRLAELRSGRRPK